MFNLVKYELKSYYKDLIIMLGVIIVLNLLLLTRIDNWQGGFFLSGLIFFAAMVVVFIWNIRLFIRDMYEDSGYLLFTIPQKGYSILGAKLITTVIQVAMVGLVAGIFGLIHARSVVDFKEMFPYLVNNVNIGFIIVSVVVSILEYVYFLLSIYLSIALSKVAIRKKKMGKIGAFVIFIILSLVTGKITELLTSTFPQVFNINIFTAQGELNLGLGIGNMAPTVPVSIAAAAFNIVLFIAMYLATAYILENKVDF